MSKNSQMSQAQREYVKQVRTKQTIIFLFRWLLFFAFILLWEVAANKDWINSFIFTPPSKIWECFVDMLLHQDLIYHIGISLKETFVGFVLVIVLSLVIAMILWWQDSISKVLEPYLVVLNSLPKSALAPVLIVWLGANTRTIIVCAMSVAIFGSILNIYTGFVTVDADRVKLIQILNGSKWDVFRRVIIPASIPNIISVMKVNIGLCLVGVIIGEFLAAKAGLGYLIIYGSQTFKMSWVFMSIAILCIIAMVLYWALQQIENKLKQYY